MNTNPTQNSIGVAMRAAPRHSVPSQLRNRNAVGTEMIMVRTMKLSPSRGLMPVGEHVVAVDHRRQDHHRR